MHVASGPAAGMQQWPAQPAVMRAPPDAAMHRPGPHPANLGVAPLPPRPPSSHPLHLQWQSPGYRPPPRPIPARTRAAAVASTAAHVLDAASAVSAAAASVAARCASVPAAPAPVAPAAAPRAPALVPHRSSIAPATAAPRPSHITPIAGPSSARPPRVGAATGDFATSAALFLSASTPCFLCGIPFLTSSSYAGRHPLCPTCLSTQQDLQTAFPPTAPECAARAASSAVLHPYHPPASARPIPVHRADAFAFAAATAAATAPPSEPVEDID